MSCCRPKVAVLVAAHCAPKVLKMTLGSWMECYDGTYDAFPYVGVHANFEHYHPGKAEMEALDGKVGLTWVDELAWSVPVDRPFDHMFRFSRMHARSLRAMMQRAVSEHGDLTHVAVLDHDLVFRSDFVGWAVAQGEDFVATLMDDRSADVVVPVPGLGDVSWAPKASAWHMVVSRRMFDWMMERPELVEPSMRDGKAYDTMARAFEFAKESGMGVLVPGQADVAEMVEHRWSMSVNYGSLQSPDPGEYVRRVAAAEAEYDARFPDGIDGMWARIGR